MPPQDDQEIREQLVTLRAEHREMDSLIAELESSGTLDQLQITRLKKQKLKLKEQITSLEDRLLPDIIA